MRALSLALSLVTLPSWLLACSEAEADPSLVVLTDTGELPDLLHPDDTHTGSDADAISDVTPDVSPDTQPDGDSDTSPPLEDTQGPVDTTPDTVSPPACAPGTYLEADACLPCPDGFICDGGDAAPRPLDRCQELWDQGETVPEGCCEVRTGATRLGPSAPLAPSDKVCILIDGAVFIEGPFTFSTPLVFVRGPLEISNLGPNDLLALSALKRVTGNLSLRNNPELTTLQGLSALEHVGGTLLLKDNALLNSLEGLDSLMWVNALELDGQRLVESLAGLSALKHLTGTLTLTNTTALRSLSGLSLDTAPKVVRIHNAGLEDLAVLEGVRELETLSLSGVSGVSSANGTLAEVTSLTQLHTLEVLNSTTLQSLDTFSSLESLHTLRLEYNTVLTSLEGLHQLPGVQVARILNNAQLCQASLDAFFESVPASVQLVDQNGQAEVCSE